MFKKLAVQHMQILLNKNILIQHKKKTTIVAFVPGEFLDTNQSLFTHLYHISPDIRLYKSVSNKQPPPPTKKWTVPDF